MGNSERAWVEKHVAAYREVKPRYELLAATLRSVLERASQRLAPLAIIQARPKAVSSFAGKILTKRYTDPLLELTDLAGGRVITHTRHEVEAFCDFLERNFDIDWENCVNAVERLRPTEFGYRSIHYIVSFRERAFSGPGFDIEIPPELIPDDACPMKAEIQVRTIFEHAWADISHDMTYKSAFEVPARWNREIAIVAALLEDAGNTIERTIRGLSVYAANYGSVLTEEQARTQMANLEIVLEHDPKNAELAARIGKLAITVGDWDRAIQVLRASADLGHVPSMRDLGFAICRKNRSDRGGSEYSEGHRLLEAAAAPEHGDVDAICSFAGTFKGVDDERARNLYRRAHEIDPSDPYALGNFLEAELIHQKSVAVVGLMRPTIRKAIERSLAQVEVGMNLPWAFYSIGLFRQLLDEPYESLRAYARAVGASSARFMVETSLKTLQRLSGIDELKPGLEWSSMLLQAGLLARFGERAPAAPAVPFAIVAGGCDADAEDAMSAYRELLLESFGSFEETLVSGGTTAGVSGLVGAVAESRRGAVRTIGYVPEIMPHGVERDARYAEVRVTPGGDFSPLEPLTAWLDMLTDGVHPADVRVIGIGGGRIAAAEYRIALALGARVAVLRGSGGAAARLLKDGAWASLENLVEIPADTETVRAFLGRERSEVPAAARVTLARAIHDEYRRQRSSEMEHRSPSLAEWDDLPEDLRESNLGQADDTVAKLRRLGYRLVESGAREAEPTSFSDDEVEALAEMEHGRWVVERALRGWTLAPEKNVETKQSPYLVSWSDLSDRVKERDRLAIRALPDLLARVGLTLSRSEESRHDRSEART